MIQITNWRETCEAAIKAHTEADAIRFWGASHNSIGNIHHFFNYRFEHTLATVKIIRWLALVTGADSEITECAAWLHDCRKFLSDKRSSQTHAKDAALAVTSILSTTDFPSNKISAVQHAINHHVGFKLTKKLKPLETACLWDADKLSKLGAAGLMHYISIATSLEKIDTERMIQHGDDWLSKAETIAKSMNTAAASKEASLRLVFITNYYNQLKKEWMNIMEPIELN